MIDPSLTQTIRMYCDGELSPDEAQQFERSLERDIELQKAVVFERTLRKRIDTVLSSDIPKAPATLISRVQEALAQDEAPAPLPFEEEQETASEPVIHQPTWRINFLAVAAVVVLVVGAVIFGIVFPQIDTIQTGQNNVAPAELLSNIGAYVSNEHDRCAGSEKVADEKFDMTDPIDAADVLSRSLKSRVVPIDLSDIGYTFYGGAPCGALPCGGPSGHMLFKKQLKDGSYGANISLFFVPEEHISEFLNTGCRRRWVENDDIGSKCGHKVLRLDYPETGLVYFLVTCDPDILEPASEQVLAQLHATSPDNR